MELQREQYFSCCCLLSQQWPRLKKQLPKPSDVSFSKDKMCFWDISYISEDMAGAMAAQFLSHEQYASKFLAFSAHRKLTWEVQTGPRGPNCIMIIIPFVTSVANTTWERHNNGSCLPRSAPKPASPGHCMYFTSSKIHSFLVPGVSVIATMHLCWFIFKFCS